MGFSIKSVASSIYKNSGDLARDAVVYRDSALALNSINKLEGRLQYIYDTSNISPYDIAGGLGKLTSGGFKGLLSLDSLKNLAKKIAFPTTIKGVGPLEELPLNMMTKYPRVLAYTHTRAELSQLRDNATYKKSRDSQPTSFLEAFEKGASKSSDNSNRWGRDNQYSQNPSAIKTYAPGTISTIGKTGRAIMKAIDTVLGSAGKSSDDGVDNFIDFKERSWKPQSDSISRKNSTGLDLIDDSLMEVRNANKLSQEASYSSSYSALRDQIKDKTLKFNITAMHIATGMTFPAYVKSFSESVNVSWQDIDFLGRSEALAVYGQTSRSYNLEFMLFVENEDIAVMGAIVGFAAQERRRKAEELAAGSQPPISTLVKENSISLSKMYDLIEFLHACTRPRYAGLSFAASPILSLSLGDFIKNQTFIIESLGISYDPLIWDMHSFVAPRFAHVSMQGRFFGARTPAGYEVMPRADLKGNKFYSRGNR